MDVGRIGVSMLMIVQGCPLYMTNTAFKELTILHTGPMQDSTQPSMELFLENKHAWVGDVTGKAKL